jgi:hypothetical protein
MGHKKTRTFRDLVQARVLLEVACLAEGCGHGGAFAPMELGGHYGFEVAYERRRWRCSKCGGTAVRFSFASRDKFHRPLDLSALPPPKAWEER